MSDGADRIRRILEDHGGAVRRASEAGAGAPPDASKERLRQRLAALRAEAVGLRPALLPIPGAPDSPGLPPEDGRTLEERVGAVLRAGARGSVLVAEQRHPLDLPLGGACLGDALARAVPLRARERRPGGRTAVHPRDAVFVDCETTGLSGGTGTVAFLVGVGRFDRGVFLVRQFFLRDFPDEPALLDAVAAEVGDAPWVTYNGRAFDAPLLATRFRLHRTPFPQADHLDLLPPARRLWAGSLEAHSLGDLERQVLRVGRAEDLPGALMPAAWFAWLREGRSAGVALAFRHNEADIVSLAALCGVVGRLVADPTSRPDAPAADHLATARLILDHGDPARARACLEAACAGPGPGARPPLRRLLGWLQRRDADWAAAERTWRAWIDAEAVYDPHPWEEIAKILEHRRRDPAAALACAQEGLARCPADDPRRGRLEARVERLRRRAARAATSAVGRRGARVPSRRP